MGNGGRVGVGGVGVFADEKIQTLHESGIGKFIIVKVQRNGGSEGLNGIGCQKEKRNAIVGSAIEEVGVLAPKHRRGSALGCDVKEYIGPS